MKKSLLLLLLFLFFKTGMGQTPGMIFENLGIQVLDPNKDGYISKHL